MGKEVHWVTDPSKGMFCGTCQRWGKPPAGSRGAWTTRGITDSAATFSGKITGVQRRIRTHTAHALYIHRVCHRLQLASIQAAESTRAVKMFGTMASLWKLFYYSPKKANTLKDVQSVLSLPELKVVKPSTTRWLSHEQCVRAIHKELPALIITLHKLNKDSGDAEACGL